MKEDALVYSEFFKPLTFGLQFLCIFDKAWRKIKKEYHNTYYICGLPDPKATYMTLEEFKKSLQVSSYNNVQGYTNKKSIFSETWSKFMNLYSKIWLKIENILDTNSKGVSIQDRALNLPDIHKVNKVDLFKRLDELKKENV